MDPGVGPPEFAPITIDLAVIEPEDHVAWKSGGRQSPRMQYMQPVSPQAVGAADDKIMGISSVHQEIIMPLSKS